MVYSARRFVFCFKFCLVIFCSCFFFSPLRIAITSLGEEKANYSAFCAFVRVPLVWFCLFSLYLGVWEGLWVAIVALPVFLLTFSISL